VSKPQHGALGRCAVVVIALEKGVVLVKWLDLDILVVHAIVTCPMLYRQVPLTVVTQPSDSAALDRHSHHLGQPFNVSLAWVVAVSVELQSQGIRRIKKTTGEVAKLGQHLKNIALNQPVIYHVSFFTVM